MSTSDEPADEGVDYQVGAHDVDTENVQFGEGGSDSDDNFVEFELEARTVFKRLAKDIYKNDKAGIREPLTNAVTATRTAIEEYDLDEDEASVHIQLYRGEEGNHRLLFRDNGIGITEATLEQVVSVIGRSTVRDQGDLAGQFGMGFLAVFRLVGTDGGFVMHTRSRKDGSESISGVWKSGGFARDTEGELPGRMEEDEYGTKFEFVLQDDISADDVREWVAEYGEWARTPVIYQEYDENGSQEFNEDYGRKAFADEYDTRLSVTLNTPHFTATTAPGADGRTILLDVPLDRNRPSGGSELKCPWPVDIRLKNESGVVVDGPHEGLMPVTEAEYNEMDEERKKQYAPRSQLTESDVVMPGPTGTRDSLARNEEFWEWLEDELEDEYEREVAEIYQDVDEVEDLFNLSQREYNLATHAIHNLFIGGKSPIQDTLKDIAEKEYSREFCENVRLLARHVELVPREAKTATKKESRETQRAADILWEAAGEGSDGEVFMGVSLNDAKCQVVWADDEDNQVVRLEKADKYDAFEEAFGWRKLREVKSSNIDDFDVPDSVAEPFESQDDSVKRSAGLPAEDRELTVRFGKGRRKITSVQVEKLRNEFKRVAGTSEAADIYTRWNAQTLILFPNHKDKLISNHYWVASSQIVLANCTKRVWNYLADLPNVMYIDEYIEQAKEVSFHTNRGELTVKDVGEDETISFHALPEEFLPQFQDLEIMDGVVDYLTKDKLDADAEDIVYAPVSRETLEDLRPVIRDDRVLMGDLRVATTASRKSFTDDMRPYMHARLPNWRGTDEFDVLNRRLRSVSLKNGGYELVETLALLHDAGLDPFSERVDIEEHLEQATLK